MPTNSESKHITESLEKLNQAKRQQQITLQNALMQSGSSQASNYSSSSDGNIQVASGAYGKNAQYAAYNNQNNAKWGLNNNGKGYADEGMQNSFKNNVFVRTSATLSDINSELTNGTLNVVEEAGDFFIGVFGEIGKMFGASDDWAKDAISFDWSRWVTQNITDYYTPMNMISNLVTGENISAYSYLNDADKGVQEFARGGANLVGEITPYVVAAVLSGGSSVGVQASQAVSSGASAQAALTSGVAASKAALIKGVATAGIATATGIQTAGGSVEQGVQSGASLDKSLEYGAIKGAISAGISVVLNTKGLSAITSNATTKAGVALGSKFANKTVEAGVSKATTIAIRAGIDGARQAALVAADPLIQQITIDGNAIQNAYGNDEAVRKTLSNVGTAFATGVITSAAIQSTIEIGTRASLKKDGYMAKYYSEKANSLENDLAKDMKKANYKASKMSQEDAKAYISKKTVEWDSQIAKINDANSTSNSYLKNVVVMTKDANGSVTPTKNAETSKSQYRNAQKTDILNKLNQAAKANNTKNTNDTLKLGDGSFTASDSNNGVYKENGKEYNITKVGNGLAVKTTLNNISSSINTYSSTPANNGIVITNSKIGKTNKPVILSDSGIENAKDEGIKTRDIPTIIKSINDNTKVIKVGDKTYKYFDMESYKANSDGTVNVLTAKDTNSSLKITNIEKMTPTEIQNKFKVNLETFSREPSSNIEDTAEGRQVIKQAANSKVQNVYDMKAATDAVNVSLDNVQRSLTSLIKTKDESYTLSKSGKTKAERLLFKDLNGKALDLAVSNSVDDIMDLTITHTYLDGAKTVTETGKMGDVLPLSVMKSFRKDLEVAITAVANASGKPSEMAKAVGYYESKVAKLSNVIVQNRNMTLAVNRALADMEATKNTFKIDKDKYKPEIENDGNLKTILSMLPRYNVAIKNTNLRMSDTNGLTLSSKYSDYADKIKDPFDKLVEDGYFVNQDIDQMNADIDILRDRSLLDGKHLGIEQIDALADLMKRIRWSVSQEATQIREERRVKATELYRQAKVILKANPLSRNKVIRALSTVSLDNMKMMDLGDGIMGFDGNILQKTIDALTVDAQEKKNKLVEDWKDKYERTKENDELDKLVSGKVEFRGNKNIKKSDLLGLWLQSQDSKTMAEIEQTPNQYVSLDNDILVIKYDDEMFPDIEKTLGKDTCALARKIYLEESYNDPDEDGMKKVGFHSEVDNKGASSIDINRDDYYPRQVSQASVKKVFSVDQIKDKNSTDVAKNVNLKERKPTATRAVLSGSDPKVYRSGYITRMANTVALEKPANELLSLLSLNVKDGDEVVNLSSLLGKETTGRLLNLVKASYGITLVDNRVVAGIQGVATVSVLGAQLVKPAKNLISPLKELHNTSIPATVKGYIKALKIAHTPYGKKIINSGTYRARYADSILSMEANANIKGGLAKASNYLMFAYKYLDQAATLVVAQIKYEDTKARFPGLSEDEIEEKAFRSWVKAANETQSTAEEFGKSSAQAGIVAGHKSQVSKMLFTFQSDVVAGANMVLKDIRQLIVCNKIMKSYTQEKDNPNNSWTDDERKTNEDIYNKAKKTRDSILKSRIWASIAILMAGGVLIYMVDDLNNRVIGRKGWGEDVFDSDSLTEITENTFESFVPYLSTIISAFKYNDGNISLFAFDGVASLIKGANELGKGQYSKGLWTLAKGASTYLGIPLNNFYNLTVGLASGFNAEWALNIKNILYGTSASTQTTNFYSDVSKGYDAKAKAELSLIMANEKAGEISSSLQNEMYRLIKSGSLTLPSSIPSEVEDSSGNLIKLTTAQKEAMKMVYSKANAKAANLIRSTSYASLSDTGKAKAIKAVYSAYYEAAKAKAVSGYEPNSKLGVLVSKTSVDVSSLEAYIQHIKELVATEDNSRKEQAVAYVNRLQIPQAEKYLVLYIGGFSIGDEAQTSVLRYLVSKGMMRSEAKDFIGME